jgi:hypothetical protein
LASSIGERALARKNVAIASAGLKLSRQPIAVISRPIRGSHFHLARFIKLHQFDDAASLSSNYARKTGIL